MMSQLASGWISNILRIPMRLDRKIITKNLIWNPIENSKDSIERRCLLFQGKFVSSS